VLASTDLELLTIQAERALDPAGRLAGQYGIAIACAPAEQALWIGAEVPDDVATELAAAFAAAGPARDPAQPPPALARCRRILEAACPAALGPVEQHAGPSFVFPGSVPSTTGVRIERCDHPHPAALRGANPGNWLPVEWDELLDGCLGPWTMVLDGDRAVSICHTPSPVTPRGAECGVWTQPGHRGRGYAAATAAAWAEILRPTGRSLFYSTDADNRSSQRVAERLHLRPIGWTWRLRTAEPDASPVHPLSALRRG
jgi:GNAT superfamily N-acetyltransferase